MEKVMSDEEYHALPTRESLVNDPIEGQFYRIQSRPGMVAQYRTWFNKPRWDMFKVWVPRGGGLDA